jgi:serine/threonine protein kinase
MTDPESGETIWKLADFGLATLLTGDELGRYYADTICGTETYMAPEVHNDFLEYSFPSDIWSLGAVIHFVCYAGHLFANEQMVMNWTRRPTMSSDRYSQAIIDMVASMNDPDPNCRPFAQNIFQECGKYGRQNQINP